MAKTMKEREFERLGKTLQANSASNTTTTTKDKTAAQSVYDKMLDDALNKTASYARQGVEQTREVANTVQGGMTQLDTGDKKNFNWDTARQAQIDQATAIKALRAMKLFDTEDYAKEQGTMNLVSTDYLKELADALPLQRARAAVEDDYNRALEEMLETQNAQYPQTALNWKTLQNDLYAMDEGNAPYYWAYADYLLNGGEATEADTKYRQSGGQPTEEYGDAYMTEYLKAWDAMTDEEYEQEQTRLKEQFEELNWDELTNKDKYVTDLYNAEQYEDQVPVYDSYMKTVNDEISRREELEALQASIRANENYGTLSQYVNPGTATTWEDVVTKEGNTYIKNSGRLNYYLNNSLPIEDQQELMHSNSGMGATVYQYAAQGYDYLTADELADYNALYNAGRFDEAARYLELLRPELLQRRAGVNEQYYRTKAVSDPVSAIASGVESIAQGVGNISMLPLQIYETAKGIDNPYSAAYDFTNAQRWTRNEQQNWIASQEIADWLKELELFGYNGFMGAADNTARLLAAGFNPTVSLIFAGGQGMSGALYEMADKDASAAAKLIKGFTSGLYEIATEKIGIDALFDMGKDSAIKYFLSEMASELGEETVNTLAEDLTEVVLSALFDYESEIKSGADIWDDLADTVYQTAGSTLFMGGGGALNMTLQNKSIVNQVDQNGSWNTLIDMGKAFGDDTGIHEVAAKLDMQQKSGKALRLNQRGAYIRQLTEAVGQQNATEIQQVLDEDIAARMVELGTDQQEAEDAAPAVRKLFLGEKLSAADKKTAKWADNAETVLRELYQPVALDDESSDADTAQDEIRAQIEEEVRTEKGNQERLTEKEIAEQVTKDVLGTKEYYEFRAKVQRDVRKEMGLNDKYDMRKGHFESALEKGKINRETFEEYQDRVTERLKERYEEAANKRAAELRDAQQNYDEEFTRRAEERMTAQYEGLRSEAVNQLAEENAETVEALTEEEYNAQAMEYIDENPDAEEIPDWIRENARKDVLQTLEQGEWAEEINRKIRERQQAAVDERVSREKEKRMGGQRFKAKVAEDITAARLRMTERTTQLEKALGISDKKTDQQKADNGTTTQVSQPEGAKTPTETSVETAVTAAAQKQESVKGLNLDAKMVAFGDEEGGSTTGEFQRVEEKDGEMFAVVQQEGKDAPTMVNLSDIEGTGSDGLTAIIEYAQNATHKMSTAQINSMIAAFEAQDGDAASFIQDYENAYLDGYTGLHDGQQNEGVTAIAYEQGKAEAQQDEQNRLQRVKNAKRTSKGEVSWIGKVTSFSEITGMGSETSMTEAMRTLTDSQKDVINAVQQFARTFGTDVVLYESDLTSDTILPNGQYDSATNTVYLDVQGGANTTADVETLRRNGTLGNAMVQYLGHELTHALEANSAEGYAAYRQAVKEAMRKRGTSYEALVRSRLEQAAQAGQKLTLGGAEAEVIANASEFMLENTEFARNAPASVKNRIKKVIKDFAKKVKAFFATLTGGSRESQALRELKNNAYSYVDNLQKLWDVAAMEMVNRQTEQNAQETAQNMQESQQNAEIVPVEELKPEKQFALKSTVEKRKDGLIAVHNLSEGNLLTMLTELEGIPAPSVAIVKAEQGHTEFGEISAIVDSASIDPQANSENRVYGADAWTQRFPKAQNEINGDAMQEQRAHAEEILAPISKSLAQAAGAFYDAVEKSGKTSNLTRELMAHARSNIGLMAEYLLEHGKTFDYQQDGGYKNNIEIFEKVKHDKEKYLAWVTEKLNRMVGRRIFAGTDLDYTAENAVQLMRQGKESSASSEYKAKEVLQNAAKRYRSLDEIRADAGRLQKVSSAEFSDFILQADEELDGILDALARKGSNPSVLTSMLGFADARYAHKAQSILERAGRENLTVQETVELFEQADFEQVNTDDVEKGLDLVKRIQNIPVSYFEAKPMRVVGLDEIRMLIAPDNIGDELITAIEEKGIPYMLYEQGNDTDRIAKMNEVEGVKFSLRDSAREDYLLSRAEYARLQSNLNDQKHGYQFKSRPNGGKMVAMDNLLVYTDRNGAPEHVLEVSDADIWAINAIQQDMMLMEERGEDHEMQRIILESVYGEERAHFRTKGERAQTSGENRKGTGRNARSVGKGDSGEISSQKAWRTQDVLNNEAVNSERQYARRDDLTMADVREIMGSMAITDSMNETEKDMLTRYKAKLLVVQDLQMMIDQQKAIIDSETATADEKAAAKARMRIYTEKQRRAQRYLRTAEGSGGFARLMATSQELARRLTSADAENAAESLETEIGELTEELDAVNRTLEQTRETMKNAEIRALFDPKKLEKAVSTLKASYGLKMSRQELRNRLAALYAAYAGQTASGQIGQGFTAELRALAADMYESQKAGQNYQSEVLEDISLNTGGTLQLSGNEVAQLKVRGISYSEFKRTLSPYIKVTRGGTGSQVLATAQATQYYVGGNTLASMMKGVMNDVDALNILYDTFAHEKEAMQEKNAPGMTREQMIQSITQEVISELVAPEMGDAAAKRLKAALKRGGANLEAATNILNETVEAARKSTNDAGMVWGKFAKYRYDAETVAEYYRALEEKRRLTELKEQEEALREQLTSEAAEKLKKRTSKAKEQIEFLQTKQREDAAVRKIKADTDKHIRKIKRKTRILSERLVNPTDARHIPQELNGYVNSLLKVFTDSALSTFAFSEKEANQLLGEYSYLLGDDIAVGADYDIGHSIESLASLAKEYGELRGAVHGQLYKGMPYRSRMGAEYENAIVHEVGKIIDNARTMVAKTNSQFLKDRHMTFKEFSDQAAAEITAKENKPVRARQLTALTNSIIQGNITPVYFFDRLGNRALSAVFEETKDAMRKTNQIVREANEFFEGVQERYHVKQWANDPALHMTTEQGHKIELTRGMAMSLYATAKREQLNTMNNTHHLDIGGFEYEDIRDIGNGHKGASGAHRMSAADMQTVSSWLTKEQKACADEVVKYMSTTLSAYGNAATMALYGYNKFGERYYFPFRSSRVQSPFKVMDNTTGQKRAAKQGFTNAVKRNANTSVIIGDFFKTATEHAYDMAYLSGTAVTAEKFGHLLNFRVETKKGEAGRESEKIRYKTLIQQKYGENAYKYLESFVRDLNGRQQNDNRHLDVLDTLSGNFRKTAVMYNMSVILQQPTSVFRAFACVDPKYFATAFKAHPMKTWNEMLQYSGAAIAKDVGGYNVGMGRGGGEYIRGNDSVGDVYARYASKTKGAWNATKHAIDSNPVANLPQTMDIITWAYIWNAVKNEQAAKNPTMDRNSKEFLELCGKRADDVLIRTQVFDSVLTRSGIMRSTNKVAKGLTAFMAEPTLSANMLIDAFTNKQYTVPQRARVVASVFLSTTMAAAAAAIAQMWRKDDDDRTVAEKFVASFLSNLSENVDPIGMLPLAETIQSALSGEDVNMDEFSNVVRAATATSKLFEKLWEGEKLTWKEVESSIGGIANTLGIPAQNVSREMRSVYNMVTSDWTMPSVSNIKYTVLDNLNVPTISTVESLFGFNLWDDGNSAYYERIAEAYVSGDMDKAQELKDYLISSKGVTEKTIDTQSKAALKNLYNAGKVDRDEAEKILMDVYGESASDAYWKVEEWEYKQENGSDSSFSRYNDFYQAVETGENLKSVIESYKKLGYDAGDLRSAITNKYIDQLAELWMTGQKSEYTNLQARVLTAYEKLGYNRLEMQQFVTEKRDEKIKKKQGTSK